MRVFQIVLPWLTVASWVFQRVVSDVSDSLPDRAQESNAIDFTAVAPLIAANEGIVYIGLLDGSLMAVDLNSGQTLWTFETKRGSLFSSAGQTLKEEDGGITVPGLDGTMYSLATEDLSLTKHPYTVRDLADTPSLLAPNGTIVTGSKQSDIYVLDPKTGDLQYARLDQEIVRPSGNGLEENLDIADATKDALIIAMTTHSIRGLLAKTGAELWNFSIGSFDIALGGGAAESAGDVPATPSGVMLMQHGDSAAALDVDSMKALWTTDKLPSPMVSSFTLQGTTVRKNPFVDSSLMGQRAGIVPTVPPRGRPTRTTLTDDQAPPEHRPAVYLGTLNGSFFALPSEPARDLGQNSHQAPAFTFDRVGNTDLWFAGHSKAIGDSSHIMAVHGYQGETPAALPAAAAAAAADGSSHSALAVYLLPSEEPTCDNTAMPEVTVPAGSPEEFGDGPGSCGGDAQLTRAECMQPRQRFKAADPLWFGDVQITMTWGLFAGLVLLATVGTRIAGSSVRRWLRTRIGNRSSRQTPDLEEQNSILHWLWNTTEQILDTFDGLSPRAARAPVTIDVPTSGNFEQRQAKSKDVIHSGGDSSSDHSDSDSSGSSSSSNGGGNSSGVTPNHESVTSPGLLPQSSSILISSRYHREFQELRRLGRGGQGTVFVVENLLDGIEYAVKKILLPRASKERDRVLREVRSLARLEHDNIVRYFHAWIEQVAAADVRAALSGATSPKGSQTGNSFSLVSMSSASELSDTSGTSLDETALQADRDVLFIQMKLCQDKTLAQYLEPGSQNSVNVPEVFGYFRQILQGLEHVHEAGLIHRDLKPANIFLWGYGKGKLIKIGDFGLSKEGSVQQSDESSPARGRSLEQVVVPALAIEEAEGHTTEVGTTLYASPEQMHGVDISEQTDMYSVGVILGEMFFMFATGMERAICLKKLRSHASSSEQNQRGELAIETQFPSVYEKCLELMRADASRRPTAKAVRSWVEQLLLCGDSSMSSTTDTDLRSNLSISGSAISRGVSGSSVFDEDRDGSDALMPGMAILRLTALNVSERLAWLETEVQNIIDRPDYADQDRVEVRSYNRTNADDGQTILTYRVIGLAEGKLELLLRAIETLDLVQTVDSRYG
jgi:serine/threonine protein kinase